mmetsp:Transcript_50576/g.127038  ORF Transcript_50576/g.127038 Transcript_50576/m.127038 type:complete len:261 (+) Transcript_50576:1206-1988(+)
MDRIDSDFDKIAAPGSTAGVQEAHQHWESTASDEHLKSVGVVDDLLDDERTAHSNRWVVRSGTTHDGRDGTHHTEVHQNFLVYQYAQDQAKYGHHNGFVACCQQANQSEQTVARDEHTELIGVLVEQFDQLPTSSLDLFGVWLRSGRSQPIQQRVDFAFECFSFLLFNKCSMICLIVLEELVLIPVFPFLLLAFLQPLLEVVKVQHQLAIVRIEGGKVIVLLIVLRATLSLSVAGTKGITPIVVITLVVDKATQRGLHPG